jgi:aminopeptidase N
MNFRFIQVVAIAALFFAGCKTNSKIITTEYTVENRILDTLSVTASKISTFKRPVYNPASERTNDLFHTKLDVSFDWENQYLNGKATLDLQPVFYPVNSVRLDAKGFDIHKVALIVAKAEIPLKYVYDNNKDLIIELNREYKKDEKYRVYIEYTAKPNELPIGGSDAITSDKGLYFINPLGKDKGKPQQIWTQGETESSSCWFPTIDRPNERCTQEMFITVQDKFKTLSNGKLTGSVKNSNGTRTDNWVMDLPHAPYLFVMVVGEFAVVSEQWNGKLLEYYVEAEYEKDAKAIYKNTPGMLTFFSEKFGVTYPWNKYSQIIVRDYVSGAMENTTAVIFGDFVQLTSRELIDHSDLNESIVAHEMMHHWFGDLVTCESWSNLPLNESFANYSEYLWFEHKYGRDAADYIRKNEIDGYMNQAVMRGDKHPLIYFGYNDKEDMFDAHSYNKGGTILHMLRYVVGDDAFFASLKKYLEDNKFKAAEVHHLRLAFEEVTGKDLNWFFNQWFLTAGHPVLEISKEYDADSKMLNITLKQTQNYKKSTVFILPFAIDVYSNNNDNPVRTDVVMTQQEQTFSIKADSEPIWVAVDAERVLLCKYKYNQSKEELINQFRLSKRFQNRYDAIKGLRYAQKEEPEAVKLFIEALDDPFWKIREKAVDVVQVSAEDKSIINKIIDIAQNDPRSHVRAAAMEKIAEFNNAGLLVVAKEAIEKDSSYLVVSAALKAINDNNPEAGLEYAQKLMNLDNPSLLNAIAAIFEKTGDLKYFSFYEQNWNKTDNYARFTFFNSYAAFLQNTEDEKLIIEKVGYLKSISLDNNVSQWGRYASSNALKKMKDYYFESNGQSSAKNIYEVIVEAITEIKNGEKDETLLKLYSSWK